jgi:hypothetical protein
MKINHKLRKIWHDWFYENASDKYLEFALKCQDMATKIDLNTKPKTASDYLRFNFHLSLCQACKNYNDFSKTLTKKIKNKSTLPSVDIQKINSELLTKYGHNNDSE